MPGMDKRVQGRLHAPCEAGERWRGTTLLTDTDKRTDLPRGYELFIRNVLTPPESGALSEYQSLINSCIGLNRPVLLGLHLFR